MHVDIFSVFLFLALGFTYSLLHLFYVTLCKLLEKVQGWTNYLAPLDLSFLILKLENWITRFLPSIIVNFRRWNMYFSSRDRGKILVLLKSQYRSSCLLCLHIKPALPSGNGKSNSYPILLSCKVTLIRTVRFKQHLWVLKNLWGYFR